jgi:NTE family protein
MAHIGIVLSGGGARGAYEAGVLWGIHEALGTSRHTRPLFDVISGSSVGAINGAWLAANAHRPDHHVTGLVKLWESLKLNRHLKLDLRALLSSRYEPDRMGRWVLDPRAFESMIRESVDWEQLHANVERGLVRAFIVSALHVGSGTTTLFNELAPGVPLPGTTHPRRTARRARIEAEHVLASAAIPALFPARNVGGAFFADGGLRFNTPISPALQAGADKLVVVTLRHEGAEPPEQVPAGAEEQYPSFVFLAGKVLNALLLDPVAEDLETLQMINAVVDSMHAALTVHELARVDAELARRHGRSYRKIDTLHFRPSRNIGVMAGEHLRERGSEGLPLTRFFLARAAHESATWEADLASYLLFDAAWATRLLELGRTDALAQRDRVRAFFTPAR